MANGRLFSLLHKSEIGNFVVTCRYSGLYDVAND